METVVYSKHYADFITITSRRCWCSSPTTLQYLAFRERPVADDVTVCYAIIRCTKYISYMETVVYSKHYADFITITCLNWKPLLQDDRFKDIIIEIYLFFSGRTE